MSLLHLFVGCRFLSSSAAAQLQAGGGERDREQLQSSCQPYQSATNGTAYSVGTGTTHTHTHKHSTGLWPGSVQAVFRRFLVETSLL